MRIIANSGREYKTAQGFLESHYKRAVSNDWARKPYKELTDKENIERSQQAERDVILALLSAIKLEAGIGPDEDLTHAITRIKQTPAAQSNGVQHYLAEALGWLNRGRPFDNSGEIVRRYHWQI
jgi:hypothetical protein